MTLIVTPFLNCQIIITNFDFFFHDFREYLDPTGGHILNPRRIVAQRLLNASDALTPEVLYETINAKGVLADTVFQAIMNVQVTTRASPSFNPRYTFPLPSNQPSPPYIFATPVEL